MSARALRLLVDATSGRHAGLTQRAIVAGLPALVAGDGPQTLVFANACTAGGIDEPVLAAFVGAGAEAGLRVVAPELPDVRSGRISRTTVDALVAVASATDGAVILGGASTGGALAILAAADSRLAGRVEAVSAIAPFADLEAVLFLATTGHYRDEAGLHAFPVETRLRLAANRSLRSIGEGTAVEELLENAEPFAFGALYDALPAWTRAEIEGLSPVRALPRITVPVDVACDPRDTFFPPTEAAALARAGARVLVTPALGHVRPRPHPGFARLVTFTDRMLCPQPAFAS